ncbi:cytochrome c family protein [Thermodesulfovibrio yellowstonii]|uniref:Cytochrome c family protein n=1 Tax=Thermodesulfovibrio yellowstonii (strain ATCC 51303 / DSM 11347 / YP87) TaxID=289376 RepID=B5YHW0_THEYD|nr:cytochrome c family protein [Thermodesulfovibrio yellowstonii]ACI21136.1 cytochrome c family protein [Thermodesulfovibrio yellowstonii DSM 11347]
MNYPVWELYYFNSGTLVAIIAVFHVFISHFAVGGGIFLWLTDLKSVREGNISLRQYVRKHVWFFLLLTMVFGGVTGVGIWFIIALSSPWATSLLIHTFVFAWAIEWVFFIVEIVSLLIYHYKFETLSDKNRLRIAFIYAASAWLSLFVINGIITFMLTPGQWLRTHSFWDGFFNPTNLPGLVFRTAICIMFAGLFGFVTAVFEKEDKLRQEFLRYCVKWLYIPLPFLIISGLWYFYSIPENARLTNFMLNKQTANAVNVFITASVILYLLSLILVFRASKLLHRIAVFILLLVGLLWMAGFEYMREYARKPYVIYGYMYSPSIMVADEKKLNKEGFLKNAKWTTIREVTEENKLIAGRELFNLQCLSCHTIKGVKNDIVEKTKGLTYLGVISQLYGQGKILDYMPKFIGNETEMKALATFIVSLHGDKETKLTEFKPKKEDIAIPPFDSQKDEYVLLAWSSLGEKCVTDSDKWFSFLYPGSSFQAILIKRGKKPEIISEGVEIHYEVQKGYENPSMHSDFWKYSQSLKGKKIPENVGLTGKALKGVFEYDKDKKIFSAEGIPVLPYRDDGVFNPYPIFEIKAVEKATGKILQTTKFVAPVSTELKCFECHGGKPRWRGISGISDETAINILRVHDRNNGTKLLESALKGKPQMCQKCHEDFIVKSEGVKGHNSFSASMHGWHANYIPWKDERACNLCHPNDAKGNTRCNRDIHAKLGIGCTQCHGKLDEHASSILLSQQGTRTSKLLLRNLKPETLISEITQRKSWIQQPDCLNCHVGFQKPKENVKAFNKWTIDVSELYRNKKDNTGKIPCIACHSSPHATYPSFNEYGKNRDNIQPIQYQRTPMPISSEMKCEVCHRVKMQGNYHHANMIRAFRNKKALPQ